MHETCDSYVVVEYNGDVYPCDFFVEGVWKLGNVVLDSWPEIARRTRRHSFASRKTIAHPDCQGYEYQSSCHARCPKFLSHTAHTLQEDGRGKEVKRLFEGLGIQDVRTDRAGNVIGVRPGKAAHPNLVFSAHLDTVFPEGTNVKVTRDGSVLKAPGIGDDCRGLAVMLAVIRAANEGHVETPRTITVVAEWGRGGVRH